MKTVTKVRLAWKYRGLYSHRKKFAGAAVAGTALALAVLIPHRAK
jgi:hypothetical protein